MGFVYRLADFARYRERVGDATYVDISRRTDPARIPRLWENLREVVETYDAPWVVQVWTVWEPIVPPDGLRHLPRLVELLGGASHIKWRYDPIIPGVHRPDSFQALARQAAASGITQGVINFIAPPGRYVRVDRRLKDLLPGWAEGMPGYDLAWQQSTARELVELAAEVGISLACCAESAVLAGLVPDLGPARCGDYDWFAALSGRAPTCPSFRGSRPGCGCARYFDVGRYGLWSRCHRCAYCYAG